jgi:hypothetical protein
MGVESGKLGMLVHGALADLEAGCTRPRDLSEIPP